MRIVQSLLFLVLAPLLAAADPEAAADPALTFHAPPKPLPEGAVTEDWPRFLGPHDNAGSECTG